jgi:hypothetical protein
MAEEKEKLHGAEVSGFAVWAAFARLIECVP